MEEVKEHLKQCRKDLTADNRGITAQIVKRILRQVRSRYCIEGDKNAVKMCKKKGPAINLRIE